MFTGDGRKLTGNDGTVYSGAIGAEQTGDGATALPEGLYLVSAVGDPTGWPSETTGDSIRIGDLVKVRSGVTITPETGDKYKAVTLTERCDISSWTLPFTADEIETTTFCDTVKTYEAGKADASGSMSGITTIGTTTDETGFLRQFIDIIKQDGSTSYDVYEQTNEVLFAYLVANKNLSKGDEIAVFAPINIFSASIGGDQAGAQSFDTSFRVASYNGINPALYRFAA